MKIENKPVESEKVVTISEHELTEIMADVASKLCEIDHCPPVMVLAFGLFSAEVLAKIFKDKGEN